MIRNRQPRRDEPSTRAASSSSNGIAKKNCRNRNVPNALKACGMIRPWYVSTQCSSRMRMNSGMIVTWRGIINVARYRRKSASRPRKRSRAKAYAARADVLTSSTVTLTAINRVLAR